VHAMGNNLRLLQKRAKLTHAQAADAMGMSYGGWMKIVRNENNLTTETIERAAKVFGVSPSDIVSEDGIQYELTKIPVVGLAGADAYDLVTFSEAENLGDAPVPPGGGNKTVAVEIRGDSMRGIGEDGWLFYFDARREPITDDLLGELCIVGLDDGRVLVKTPYRGRAEGTYDLESTNAPTIRGVRIDWAGLITAIIPRRAARRLK